MNYKIFNSFAILFVLLGVLFLVPNTKKVQGLSSGTGCLVNVTSGPDASGYTTLSFGGAGGFFPWAYGELDWGDGSPITTFTGSTAKGTDSHVYKGQASPYIITYTVSGTGNPSEDCTYQTSVTYNPPVCSDGSPPPCVVPVCSIDSFTADDPNPAYGTSTPLRFSFSGGSFPWDISLLSGNVSPSSTSGNGTGSIVYSGNLNQTTTYRLTCQNDVWDLTVTPSGSGSSTTCDDINADNYGGPVPCGYSCQDTGADNYGGSLPCTYPSNANKCIDSNADNYGGAKPCQYSCRDTDADNYGGALPCEYTISACQDEAEVSVSGPSSLLPGEPGTFEAHVKNTGGTWWYHGGYFQLRQKSSLDISPSYGHYTPSMSPGSERDFNFTLTAPVELGTYALRMQNIHKAGADYQDGNGQTCAPDPAVDTYFGQEGSATFSVTNTPVMSGILTPPTAPCQIAASRNSCEATLTWDTENPEATSAVVTPENVTLATGNSGTQNFTVPYGEKRFFLYNNSKELDDAKGEAECAPGTTWLGSSCEPSNSPTLTVTADKYEVEWNEGTRVRWDSENTTSCSFNGTDIGSEVDGSRATGGLTTDTNYRVTCSGPLGSVSGEVTVQVAILSGTLLPGHPNCDILAGASTCFVTLTWDTRHPQGVSAITSPTNVTEATGNSGTRNFRANYGAKTFSLYNNAVLLAESTSVGACAAGSSWNGNMCVAIGNGGWSNWSTWGECSSNSCDTVGTQSRVRTCTNPPPSNGGQWCQGPENQVQSCYPSGCTVCANGATNPPACDNNEGVIGQCGATHYSCIPSSNISTSRVNGISAWAWVCPGSGGGPNASCSELKKKPTFQEQ